MLCHLMSKLVLCKMGNYLHKHSEHHGVQTPYRSCDKNTRRLCKDPSLKINLANNKRLDLKCQYLKNYFFRIENAYSYENVREKNCFEHNVIEEKYFDTFKFTAIFAHHLCKSSLRCLSETKGL